LVVGCVTVAPPYEAPDCTSHNPFVLDKVKAIVEKMYQSMAVDPLPASDSKPEAK